ncbi:SAF domain-containing protein [Niveomyces insectorum RCEF 264]|uniref:SAF domain-containing protein n=1 Tax=Niveomyces insectorum RCEF 264 TaxID=1081102 RepID=A0A167N7F3_9HYPO|nr:SAF domain-containing protein [Niveomyces insectorum RCEF 264]
MSSISEKLAEREASGRPIQVGVIGAGKFGTMFICQSHITTGMRLAGVAELKPKVAYAAFKRAGYPESKTDTTGTLSLTEGIKAGKTVVTTDSAALIAHPEIDVILEVTGSPAAGVRHALLCCEHKKHIVMVNVEADALAGPLLARKAKEAGIIYSMAYGDQPSLISELVDWARMCGFKIVCAGKGNKFLPQYNYSTPETVWDHWGFTKEQIASDNFNSQIYNSFLDGTKSALEMAAVANGCGLECPTNGLSFTPCGYHDLAKILKPISKGGRGEKYGTVDVVSSLETDGRDVYNHARFGVFVVIEDRNQAHDEYQKNSFAQYGLETDDSGRFATQYKPFHLIGLEVGVSVANIMCRGEATGQTKTFAGDVVACAKRDLKAGEFLDGEGGYTVVGKLMPAEKSLELEGLPIGLAHSLKLKRDVKKDKNLSWADVEYSEKSQVVAVRREMEEIFRKEFTARSLKKTNGVIANGTTNGTTNGVTDHAH